MTKTITCFVVAVSVGLALPAIAQQGSRPGQGAAIPKGVFLKGQQANEYLARDRLIGAKVVNREGAVIGDIEDLIIGYDQRVAGVIMGTGGFLGAGEKRIGVRLTALQLATKDGRTVVTLPWATKEVLAALEPYKRAEPPRSLVDRAKEKAKELSDKTKDSAGPLLEKAKETAGQAYEKAKDAAGQAYDKAKDATK